MNVFLAKRENFSILDSRTTEKQAGKTLCSNARTGFVKAVSLLKSRVFECFSRSLGFIFFHFLKIF